MIDVNGSPSTDTESLGNKSKRNKKKKVGRKDYHYNESSDVKGQEKDIEDEDLQSKRDVIGELVSSIKSKYKNNLPFTEISSKLTIVANPKQETELFSDSVSYKYISHTLRKEYTQQKQDEQLPPHIYSIAGRVLRRALDNLEDTSVLFLGDVESGKTQSSKLLIRQLTRLSRATNQGSRKIASGIQYVDTIFDAFGTYVSSTLSNRSLVARYTEIQYNETEIIGAKILCYLLNFKHITDRNPSDRNVNIFHCLLAGATEKEYVHFRLDTASNSPYIKIELPGSINKDKTQQHNSLQHTNDKILFNELCEHMKYLGFNRRIQFHIFRTISLILHLGLVSFVDVPYNPEDRSESYRATIKTPSKIEPVAELMGVNAKSLIKAFLTQTRQSKNGDVYDKHLTAKEASKVRDDLAETLYNLLFSYIIEHINKKLCQDDFIVFIGVVDFPGFEPVDINKYTDTHNKSPISSKTVSELYKLLKNYANENLVNYMCERLSMWNIDYLNDGIRSVAPKFTFQNPFLILALAGGKNSLLSFIEKLMADPNVYEILNNNDFAQLNSVIDNAIADALESAIFQKNTIMGDNPNTKAFATGLYEKPDERFNDDIHETKNVAHPPIVDESVFTLVPATSNIDKINSDRKPKHSKSFKSQLDTSNTSINDPNDKKDHNKIKQSFSPPILIVKHYGDTKTPYNFVDILNSSFGDTPPDLATLIVGNKFNNIPPSANAFLIELVSDPKFGIKFHFGGKENKFITVAPRKNAPQRAPSIRRRPGTSLSKSRSITGTWRKANDDKPLSFNQAISDFLSSIIALIETLNETIPWFVFCVNTTTGKSSGKNFESKFVGNQLKRLGIDEISYSFNAADYGVVYTLEEFLSRYQVLTLIRKFDESVDPSAICEDFVLAYNWTRYDMSVGRTHVFLSDNAWLHLENEVAYIRSSLAAGNANPDTQAKSGTVENDNVPYQETDHEGMLTKNNKSFFNDVMKPAVNTVFKDDQYYMDSEQDRIDDSAGNLVAKNDNTYNSSVYNQEATRNDKTNYQQPTNDVVLTEKDTYNVVKKRTLRRKIWLFFSDSLTFCCFSDCLGVCCRIRGNEAQSAWREKIAFNFIVYLLSCSLLFVIMGFTLLVCPKANVYTTDEVKSKKSDDNPLMYAYGRVFEVKNLRSIHEGYLQSKYSFSFSFWEHKDVTPLFDLTKNQLTFEKYCPGYILPDNKWKNYVDDATRGIDSSLIYKHDYTEDPDDEESRVKPYLEHLINGYTKYRVAWTQNSIKNKKSQSGSTDPTWVVVYGNVYDISTYWISPFFDNKDLDNTLKKGFNTGEDISRNIRNADGMDSDTMYRFMSCMNGLFYRGVIDPRDDYKCVITKYILLVMTGVAVGVIGIKYISAFRFSRKLIPEKQEKFIICVIPCYTEDQESLSASINSVARSDYDDRFKLLFIICDGYVTGGGNSKPTAEVLSDVLKIPKIDRDVAEPFAFKSLGVGYFQNNYAKIYSGIYEDSGGLIPYILVVKTGTEQEYIRPGQRGKRDSHLILMRFLNRVHYNLEMNPLELEMYRIMTEVIGVNPLLYEYILMLDADTVVYPDAMNRLVSRMTIDSKIVGLCGLTEVSNSKYNWVTMVQVYEYYISHTISKSFESLFGTVTCLPGCFCMYRIRSLADNTPYFCSSQIFNEYSNNLIDTLHLKNLLDLGEDRYLTTLMIKHFPYHKTSYIPEARCRTSVPDSFSVLISQRRRWINSTIHNLIELINIQQLCGACLFSMRFIVIIDMLSTLVQPVSVVYIGFLIYLLFTQPDFSVTISLLMIATIYGFQALLAIFNLEWENILWLLIHIVAVPYFSFWIPVYSFWNVDDFSWGKTRKLASAPNGNKDKLLPDERDFDPSQLPLKSVSNYQRNLVPDPNSLNTQSRRANLQTFISNENHTHMNNLNQSQYMSTPTSYYTQGDPQSIYAPPQQKQPWPQHQYDFINNSQVSVADVPVGGEDFLINRYDKMQSGMPNTTPEYPNAFQRVQSSMSFRPQATLDEQSQYPSKQELLNSIRYIILNEDLMTLTKKRILQELGRIYNMDFSERRKSINKMVDEILHNKA